MKTLIITIIFGVAAISSFASSSKSPNRLLLQSDTLTIQQGDTTEYEILIVESGFESWMVTNAKPRWYYTNDYYRNKNQFYIIDWNNRVLSSMHALPFENRINYDPNIDYGLEVNYQLYWYFKFIENKYGIHLRGSGKDR